MNAGVDVLDVSRGNIVTAASKYEVPPLDLPRGIWVAVAGLLVPDFIYNIGTTVLNGGISMVIFFFVNKIIFPEGEAKKEN